MDTSTLHFCTGTARPETCHGGGRCRSEYDFRLGAIGDCPGGLGEELLDCLMVTQLLDRGALDAANPLEDALDEGGREAVVSAGGHYTQDKVAGARVVVVAELVALVAWDSMFWVVFEGIKERLILGLVDCLLEPAVETAKLVAAAVCV